MRVVLLVGRSTGGIGTHVAQLAGDLRALGDDVRVVAHPVTAARFDLGAALAWWPRRPADLARAATIRRLVRGADIVHAHGHQAGLVACLLLAGAGSRRPPLVVSWHNAVLAPLGAWRRGRFAAARWDARVLVQRWVARRADLVTGASSDLVAEAWRLGADPAELAPVPSPRVPELRRRRRDDGATLRSRLLPDVADEVPLVLTVSRVASQKNLPLLVRAAATASARRPLVWVVLGEGDVRLLGELEDLRAATGAPVRFAGARRDVADWLLAADLFVLPSTWEARALAVQEAMAAGLPVIAFAVGGLPELLDGVGVLVALDGADSPGGRGPLGPDGPDNADATQRLADAVAALLDDPERRADLGRRGRAAAAALPDGAETARRWHARYAALRAARNP